MAKSHVNLHTENSPRKQQERKSKSQINEMIYIHVNFVSMKKHVYDKTHYSVARYLENSVSRRCFVQNEHCRYRELCCGN